MYTTLISPDQLASLDNDSEHCIIDCRFSLDDTSAGRNAFLSGHIPGAVYAHLDNDLSGQIVPGQTGRHPLPDVDDVAELFGKWGIDEQVQVVAYDDKGGMVASRLWWMLHWLGHESAAVLDGGLQGWVAAGYQLSTLMEKPGPRTFTPKPNPDLILQLDELETKFSDGTLLVIDARAAERYRGEVEPIDPVAGHIPSAISAPFVQNLNEAGYFLAPDQLKKRFEEILGDQAAEQAVCYCGSGVSACHNLLAAEYAGIRGIKLYPGSWSEWITNPQRPVATGPNPS